MNVCNILHLTLYIFIMACRLGTETNKKMKRLNHDTLTLCFVLTIFLTNVYAGTVKILPYTCTSQTETDQNKNTQKISGL